MNYKCNSRLIEGRKSSVMLTNAWSQRESTAGSLPAHHGWSWNQCLPSTIWCPVTCVRVCGLHMQCYAVYSTRRMQIVFLIDLRVALRFSRRFRAAICVPWCMQKTVSKLWRSGLTIYRLFDRESNWRQLDVMNALLSRFPSDVGDILWLWFKCVMQPNNKKHHVCLNGGKAQWAVFLQLAGGKNNIISGTNTV